MLKLLYDDEIFKDIDVYINDKYYRFHKCILSFSPMLNMFMIKDSSAKIQLNCHYGDEEYIVSIIKTLYGYKLDNMTNPEIIEKLLIYTNYLLIDCNNYFTEHFDSIASTNLCQIIEYLNLCYEYMLDKKLLINLINHILKNGYKINLDSLKILPYLKPLLWSNVSQPTKNQWCVNFKYSAKLNTVTMETERMRIYVPNSSYDPSIGLHDDNPINYDISCYFKYIYNEGEVHLHLYDDNSIPRNVTVKIKCTLLFHHIKDLNITTNEYHQYQLTTYDTAYLSKGAGWGWNSLLDFSDKIETYIEDNKRVKSLKFTVIFNQ